MQKLTFRHLGGGFLGGVLGILAFGLIKSWTMPIGCLLGVLLGFYPDVIFQEVKKSWLASISWLRSIQTPSKSFNVIWDILHKKPRLYQRYLVWKLRRAEYFAQHPMNRADYINSWVVSLFLISHFILLIVVCALLIGKKGEAYIAYSVLSFAITVFPIIFLGRTTCWKDDSELKRMRHYYRQYEFYSKNSDFLFFGREFLFCCNLQLVALAWVTSVAFASVLWCVMCLPIWSFVLLLRALYQVSRQTSHWLCLGTVLIVTSATAYLLRDSLSGQTLWLSSLGNGIVCASLSELARRLTATFFQRQVSLKIAATTPLEKWRKKLAFREMVYSRLLTLSSRVPLLRN